MRLKAGVVIYPLVPYWDFLSVRVKGVLYNLCPVGSELAEALADPARSSIQGIPSYVARLDNTTMGFWPTPAKAYYIERTKGP